ncbi:MAG: SIR2 family protein, partial [Chloroflexi bacterium]|nr:SIR2 family protein [Chloroflexota bacterium]
MAITTISLDTAIHEIKSAFDSAQRHDIASPFWFLIGAGVSYPSVPLAAGIISDCRREVEEQRHSPPSDVADPIDQYSNWLNAAFPQAWQRQRYFKQLIESRSISPANFRLAHLLLNESTETTPLPTLVVTTNFDDHLVKALRIFGKRYVISDHPATSVRIVPEDQSVLQVVHVHGSYEFYDISNLRGEISQSASPSNDHMATMASLLESVLRNRSPLVVGYSGWEGDVVMSAIRKRLNNQMPNNIYWFCHTREAADQLPDYLKDHEHVRLVVPESQPVSEASIKDDQSSRSRPDQEFASENFEVSQTNTEGAGTLPAHVVFEAMIREFDVPAPRFTLDPLGFLAQQLRDELPEEDLAETGDTLYSLGRVVDQIQRARVAIDSGERQLDEIRAAIRTARYREAIQLGQSSAEMNLSDDQKEELISMMFSSAMSLLDDSPDEQNAYELVSTIGAEIDTPSTETRRTIARAMLYNGITFGKLGRSEEAIKVYDELIERYSDDEEPGVRTHVAVALRGKGVEVRALGRSE